MAGDRPHRHEERLCQPVAHGGVFSVFDIVDANHHGAEHGGAGESGRGTIHEILGDENTREFFSYPVESNGKALAGSAEPYVGFRFRE